MRKPIIAGNWKMHKRIVDATDFAKIVAEAKLDKEVEAVICAPFTAIKELGDALVSTEIGVGAQNMHFEEKGAFTGEISAPMLKEIGTKYVIIGHSERRQYFGETDLTVNLKLKKALEYSLVPIVCVGETLEQREKDETKDIIKNQVHLALQGIDETEISKVVIAYEPIWAIGTGKTATSDQANEVCKFIRQVIQEQCGSKASEEIRIQYGGSVNPKNVKEIMSQSDIDGALVGGAALLAEEYVKLVNFKEY